MEGQCQHHLQVSYLFIGKEKRRRRNNCDTGENLSQKVGQFVSAFLGKL